jgi:hypothetical protein
MTPVEWKRESSGSHIERAILTGMIVSDSVLRRLSLVYKPGYMTTPFTRTVASWCLGYFQKYDKAPQSHIQDLYEIQRRSGLDPDQAQLIGRFLSSISQEHERETQFNAEYVINQAEAYFQERSVILLRDTIDQHIETGNWLEAHAAVAGFHQVESTLSMGFEPMVDAALIRRAFEPADPLFVVPGALGQLIGPLERDFLLGVAAPYKRGKTWALGYFALQGLYNRCNVAFFTLEMPELRMTQRFFSSLTGMPLRPPPQGVLFYPVWDCYDNQIGACTRPQRPTRAIVRPDREKIPYRDAPKDYRPCSDCRGRKELTRLLWKAETWIEPREVKELTWRIAIEKGQAISEGLMGSRFKMESWPPYSAGISQIKATLQIWEYTDNFVPDIIIVDYADILKPEEKSDAERHKLDRIWKGLKALAHERHCLVITATQTNKTTMDKPNMKQGDVSEDARKLGHVDAMIGINQTDVEKANGVSRIVVTAQRYEGFSMLSQAIILQQLAAGQWCLDSAFKKTVG